MYCRHCGKENLDDSIFCEHCGQRIRSQKNSAPKTDSVSRLTENIREITAKLNKETADRRKTPPKTKKSFRIPQKTVAAAALLLCVAVLVLAFKGTDSVPVKNTGSAASAPGKNERMQTIYVADGRALVHPGSQEFSMVYAYELSGDGLPKVGYTINCEDYANASSVVYYAFDYEGVVRDYADLIINASGLSSEEKSDRYDRLAYELMRILATHGIDPETTQPKIIGMEDSRVAVSVENRFFDFTEYNAQGKNASRAFYYMDRPVNQYAYSYDSDGNLKTMEVDQMNGQMVRFEYHYGSTEQPSEIKTTFLQDGKETSSQVARITYDTNGMQISSHTTADGSTNVRYHYQKIQVPEDAVSELCNIYDYLGIRYFLGAEDIIIPNNLTPSEISQYIEKAGLSK